jgi:hypothetical protein
MASAGPPLLSDDPHTIGAGSMETIVALEALGRSPAAAIGAPLLDWTLGLSRDVDATVVGSPVIERHRGGSWRTSSFLEVGVKWQPLRTPGWNASFSPAFELLTAARSSSAVALPVQLEAQRGPALAGVDVGYIAVSRGADRWRAGAYAGFELARDLTALAEVWSTGTPASNTSDVALGLGFDWRTPLGFHVLASAGTGLASRGAPRLG